MTKREMELQLQAWRRAANEKQARVDELEAERDALEFRLKNREGLVRRAIKAEEEYHALAAHVEELREGLHQALIHWGPHCTDEDGAAYAECERRCDEIPTTSLSRRDARMKAEALDSVLRVGLEEIEAVRDHYRRQAEEETTHHG